MTSNILLNALVGVVVMLHCTPNAATEKVVGWRTDGTGRYPQATPPTHWSEEDNVVWRTSLPGAGYGSPIVVNDRIIAVSEPAEVLCFRRADGAVLWQRTQTAVDLLGEEKEQAIEVEYGTLKERKRRLQRELRELKRVRSTPSDELDRRAAEIDAIDERIDRLMETYPPPIKRGGAGNAASTPVSDGRSVYASFGTGIVGAYDLNGQRKWMKFVEGSRLGFGHASSPALVDGKLILHFHDLVALDAENGDELWRRELPARHATPLVTGIDDVPVVVTPAGAIIRAADGKLLTERAFSVSESSVIVDGRMLYAYENGRIKALRLPETITEAIELELVWEESASRGRRTPSAVLQGGLLYAVDTSGILDINDAATGASLDRRRLDIGKVYSSATAAGDLIYLSGVNGTTVVIEAGQPYREVARGQLDSLGSSPVFVGQRMYVRSRKYLYCIGH